MRQVIVSDVGFGCARSRRRRRCLARSCWNGVPLSAACGRIRGEVTERQEFLSTKGQIEHEIDVRFYCDKLSTAPPGMCSLTS